MWHNFSSTDPVCVYDGAIRGLHQIDMPIFDFSGRRSFRIEGDPALLRSPAAVWHEEPAILAWLSCEQNINHFTGETLGPIFNLHRAGASVIIASPAFWPHPDPDGCVGSLFTWMFALMPTLPHVFLARSSTASEQLSRHRDFFKVQPPSLLYSAVEHTSAPLQAPHCFRSAYIPRASRFAGGEFYRSLASRAGGLCSRGEGYTLFLQRASSRRIVNEDDVARALHRRFGLPVRVVTFENQSAKQQLSTACGARVFLGAHGMGMEWAHFINRGSGQGLVIELSWPGCAWPRHP